jgi:hypothetical protein
MNRLRLPLLLLAVAFAAASSCVHADDAVSDTVTISGQRLSLKERGGKVLLILESGGQSSETAMLIKPPAFFVREGSEVQSFAYPKRGVDAVILVGGTPLTPERLKLWKVDPKTTCGSEIQGVMISKQKVTVSDKTLTGGLWCKDISSDEKNFSYFAEQKAP